MATASAISPQYLDNSFIVSGNSSNGEGDTDSCCSSSTFAAWISPPPSSLSSPPSSLSPLQPTSLADCVEKEFDFSVYKESAMLSPDELFYKGHLLPLHTQQHLKPSAAKSSEAPAKSTEVWTKSPARYSEIAVVDTRKPACHPCASSKWSHIFGLRKLSNQAKSSRKARYKNPSEAEPLLAHIAKGRISNPNPDSSAAQLSQQHRMKISSRPSNRPSLDGISPVEAITRGRLSDCSRDSSSNNSSSSSLSSSSSVKKKLERSHSAPLGFSKPRQDHHPPHCYAKKSAVRDAWNSSSNGLERSTSYSTSVRVTPVLNVPLYFASKSNSSSSKSLFNGLFSSRRDKPCASANNPRISVKNHAS